MGRTIDLLIEKVWEMDSFSLTERQVIVSRLDPHPSRDELERAKERLKESGRWDR